MPRIAIIYLTYHSDEFIGRFIDALAQLSYPKDRLAVYVVDHPHPEFGSSLPALENVLCNHPGAAALPEIKMFKQLENRGFSGGINVGIHAALQGGAEYVFLHSHDGFLTPHALQKLVQVMEADTTIGVAQALMRSYPETTQINNAGGLFQFLGFGSISTAEVRSPKSEVRDIGYASGGAVLLRAELLQRYGLWDEDYFLYHEDIEYSLRLRSVGYRIVVVPDAVLYHHYDFGRNPKKWFFMERNRFGLLLSVYKLPTLLVLLPLGLVTEIAVLVFAFQHGWLKEKLAAYRYWLNPTHYPVWLAKRKKFQLQRTVGDKALLQHAVAHVSFAQTDFDSSFMRAGNTVMSALLRIIKKIVWW
jgi:GT2 family glycosyltransferase